MKSRTYPDMWDELIDALTEYQDILIARKRIQEAENNAAILRPISELRALLEADELLEQ